MDIGPFGRAKQGFHNQAIFELHNIVGSFLYLGHSPDFLLRFTKTLELAELYELT